MGSQDTTPLTEDGTPDASPPGAADYDNVVPFDDVTPSERLMISLDGYEGPLDLLLSLARTQKVDLTKISILALAEQYLEFITTARALRLEIAADFLSTDAVRFEPGMRAVVDGWGGGRVLAARVSRVEPFGFMKISALGVEEQRVWVVVDFDEDREHWRALGDGYRVEVRVVIYERDDALKIPTSSLFRHGEGWAVFAVDGGRARLTDRDRSTQRSRGRGARPPPPPTLDGS